MGEKNPEFEAVRSVEQTANYEGNASELLFSRLRNPHIKSQLLALYRKACDERATEVSEYVDRIDPNTGKVVLDEDGNEIQDAVLFRNYTDQEIEEDIERRIAEAENSTNISFTGKGSTEDAIDLDYRLPSGQKPNTKQQSIIEAHEKGHVIRTYNYGPESEIDPTEYIVNYFHQAFDFSQVQFTEDDYKEMLQLRGKTEQELPFEKAVKSISSYMRKPTELAERMSQLKNYFGMKGNEEFTKEHLDYARAHYIEDTGLDNFMTHFFQAITPEKEDTFLEVINSVGI